MVKEKKTLVRICIMLGFLIACSIFCVIFHKSNLLDLFTGGIPILIIYLIHNIRMLKNKDYKVKTQIEVND